MVDSKIEDRAVKLSREAVELIDAGHKEAASRNLREALSLAPENHEVKAAFLKIRGEEESGHPLLVLCRQYVTGKNEDAGKDAARYLHADGANPPGDISLECLNLILAKDAGSLSATQDEIISGLVRQTVSVRRLFSSRLQVSVTTFFDEIYDRGDNAVVCLDTVVLDPTLWPSEDIRLHCESELFQLFIAKLMESGHDQDARSLKGITRLLAVDAEKLQHLIDDEGFDVILSSLDYRLPLEVRGQATVATAKYLEASKEVGQKRFSDLITAKVAKARNDDLIVAFSAAAAVFPVVPALTSSLFLTEGFLPSIVPLLHREAKSPKVELALLELFNAACMDRLCREAISKNCGEWLSHILSNGSDASSELAAVVLAKVRTSEKGSPESNDKTQGDNNHSIQDLVNRFKGQMSDHKVTNVHNPIEGLAFASVKPDVKEQLAYDPVFLKGLFDVLHANLEDTTLLYGGLMIIANITRYLPSLSEEQKKISELKAYAEASKTSSTPNELEDDLHVTKRCTALIDANIMPLLADCGKSNLKSIHDLTSKILVSLSKNSKTRGKLAQQGAVKLLLYILGPKTGSPVPTFNETTHNASLALARILISVNPSHVFPYSGFPQVTSAIRPLVALLKPPEASFSVDQPRNLLPVFESLLALTNLASSPDSTASETIVRQAWDTVEDLLLSNNTFIQRAACELICNLMTCEPGIVKFADGSKRAGQRLHVLLALTDVDDVATRRAAGGALAMLTEYDAAISAVLERPRGVNLLLGLCQENNDDLVHRGIVSVRNLTCIPSGDIGKRALDAVKQGNGVDILKSCLQRSSNPAILQAGVEALKPLVEQSQA
ncbi:actin cytoskeleton organization protein (Cro1), putative [Talaromyces stipitatus ATCC 10500]|uniref:Actin cytoskeleton organization protein (Cro1), putative n=1 Tax=Talaromyces stipitatus (strain ATCC 10500 / CBS 375.48 / QM 6759 / NRRL 1006) TaxID=441959 RepID=B8LY55_TALSN|nr:actin cytoskeleton organization protein (Cro1), putative [Talaromyces stipitatus ATCC 10500]EED23300.1 actin cytoskeleton organization protein (Cro1), putative [Talaromyces stipitatus ATCC 10500]